MYQQLILIIFILTMGCNAQPEIIRSEADAMKFIGKQKYVNPYNAKAEELQAVVDKFVMEPLVYAANEELVMNNQDLNTTTIQPPTTTTENATKATTYMDTTTVTEIHTTTGDNDTTIVTSFTINTTVVTTTEAPPSQCQIDLRTFQLDLLKGEKYAEMMLDSYGKLPPGILQGNVVYWFGLYDECLKQSRNINDGYNNFKAEYCIVKLTTKKKTPLPGIGVCVPKTCRNTDLMELLGSMSPISEVSVSYVLCNDKPDYTPAAIVCLVVLSLFGLLIVVGTVYDILRRYDVLGIRQDGFQTLVEEHRGSQSINYELPQTKGANSKQNVEIKTNSTGLLGEVLLCFSLLINGGKILKTKQGEQSLGALNGIRVISLWWVILGHTYVFPMTLFSNTSEIFNVLSRFSFQAVGNATFSVDSFFFLSGLLITYLTLKYLQNHDGKLNWVMFYVHRYLRLTPVYALVIFIYATLPPYFANGPIYQSVLGANPPPGVETQATYCQKYWWTNLLYINNLYPSALAEECLAWSWYLANDMQFYIISPFVIYLLYRYFFAGVAAWSVLLLTSFGSLIGVSIKYHVTTNLIPQTPDQKTIAIDQLYVRPWTRIPTYLVGMAIGYILYKYKGRVRMTRLVALLGWMAATGIALAVVYGLYGNFHGRPLNEAASVVYVTLSRFSWSVALGWVAFACATGYGGPVNTLLSWPFWIPLVRINYCAYLLHPIIMFVFYYSLPNLIYFTDFLLVYFFLGNLVLSYAAAFVLSISVEAPFMALEKLLLNRDKSV